jgi:hypothetical protein
LLGEIVRLRKSFLIAFLLTLFFAGLTYLSFFIGAVNQTSRRTDIEPRLTDGLYRIQVSDYMYGKFTVVANVNGLGFETININDATLDDIADEIFKGEKGMMALMVINDGEIYNWTWVEQFRGEQAGAFQQENVGAVGNDKRLPNSH